MSGAGSSPPTLIRGPKQPPLQPRRQPAEKPDEAMLGAGREARELHDLVQAMLSLRGRRDGGSDDNRSRRRRDAPPSRGLPPGPPLPAPLQTAIWSRQARRLLFACRERYGEHVHPPHRHEGTWVMLSDPEAVKQVFTGDPRVFHAGEGNQILEPVARPRTRSSSSTRSPTSASARLLLPPFHGERMQGYRADDGRDRRARDRELADRHPLPAAAADAGDHARRSSSAPSSASARGSARRSCATRCAASST